MRLKRTAIPCDEGFDPRFVRDKTNKDDSSVRDNLVTDKVIDIDVPCRVFSDKPKEGEKMLNLVKDLKLDLRKDLGISGWTSDGIFILPEITVQQVQNICSLIRAKNGSEQRVYT